MVAGAVAGSAGCGDSGAGGSGLPVVATTTQTADFVRAVGGTRVDVHGVLAPNSDPHEYEPRPSDARAVAAAKLVVRSGGDVDDWLGDVIDNAGGDATVLTLIDHVQRRGDDPHWWQDPRNVVRAVGAIADALADADPGGAGAYRANARAYVGRLRALDEGIARCMRSVPAARRKLVTSHDSLAYLAAHYDIDVVGSVLPALSTEAQPSAGDTDRLVRRIRAEHVSTIFTESALDPRLERAIAREAGAHVGKRLWADALGPSGSDGATYLEAMASNADALVRGFTDGERGCPLHADPAPPRGGAE